jgi:hypothetical protein
MRHLYTERLILAELKVNNSNNDTETFIYLTFKVNNSQTTTLL